MNNNDIYHKKYLKYKKKYLDLKNDIELQQGFGWFFSSSTPTKKLRDAMLKEYKKYKKDAMKKYPKIYYNGQLSNDNIRTITEYINNILEIQIPIEIRSANLESNIKKEGNKETIDLKDDLVQSELAKIMTLGTGSSISIPGKTDIYPLTQWAENTVISNLKDIHTKLVNDGKMQKYFNRMQNSEKQTEKDKYNKLIEDEPPELLVENIKELNKLSEEAQKCETFFKNGKFNSYVKKECEKYKIQAMDKIGNIFQKINNYETKQSKVIDEKVKILQDAKFELKKLGIKYSNAIGEQHHKEYSPEVLRSVQQRAIKKKKYDVIKDLNLYGLPNFNDNLELDLAKIQEYIMKQETIIDKEDINKLMNKSKSIQKAIEEITNM